MTINGKTWSRGANSRLPFGVKGNLDLSITIQLKPLRPRLVFSK